jgi:CheY-like chemotaxis protein
MLGRLGHRVTACGSIGELTQCLAQGTACDMVITDLEMGAFSGKEVLDRVRQTGQPVPVAVVTGRGDFDEASAAAMGFDGYLPKPLTLASLALLLGEPAGQAYEPASLERLFDGDREAVLHVLDTFVAATREHLLALEQALAQHSFDAAQPLCHKMLPMFMQVNAPATVVALLKKMDAARRTGSYAGWEKDTTLIVEETRWLLGQIRETYFGGA